MPRAKTKKKKPATKKSLKKKVAKKKTTKKTPLRKVKKTVRKKTARLGAALVVTSRASHKASRGQVKKKTVTKRKTRKTTTKKPIKKTIKRKIGKLSNRKKIKNRTQKLKPKTSLLFYSVTKPVSRTKFIQREKGHISPYVLDLKKIQSAKNISEQAETAKALIISQEIFSQLNKKTNRLRNKIKNTKNRLRNIKFSLKPKKRPISFSQAKTKPKIKVKLKLPKFNLPEFNFILPKLTPQEIKFGSFIIPPYWHKALLGFIVFSLIFVLPFALPDYYQNLKNKKDTVFDRTTQALMHLAISQKAASAQDLFYTQVELQAAANNFSQAKNEINDINLLIKTIIKLIPEYNKQFDTAEKLVSIGEKLTKSAIVLTATLDKLNLNNEIDSLDLTNKLIILKDSLNLILPDLKTANTDLQQIHLEEIPSEYQARVSELQIALPILEKNIISFISSSDLILSLLGHESKKRYLLLFQNNNEIRPTGGFIGSFALVDIDQGNIEKINIPGGGPYDLKAGLKVSIESPEPLHLINHRWEFQDANWFADLPTSAEKLIWFYEKSGGPTVDGLIFVNATFLEKILSLIGPIELPEYNKTITAQNFFQEVQSSVELEYDKTINKPKQIIADLTPKIINTLLQSDKKQFTEILDLILTSLNEKEIQLYFTNFTLEKAVLKNNWGGQLKNTDLDYLNVLSTNIAGEKTDAKIEQIADLEVDIQADGSIINTLKITKTHTGIAGENFYGVPNLDYLRIYTPKGSQLISNSGYTKIPKELLTIIDPSIYQKDPEIAFIEMTKKIDPATQTETFIESDKTVFANWLRVEPGETKTITIKYKLPFKINLQKSNTKSGYFDILKSELNLSDNNDESQKYSLLWQKQSGKNNFNINLNIKFPTSFNYQTVYPANLIKDQNNFTFSDTLNSDKFLAIIFSPL